jgi:hypothetical protein
LLLRTYAFLVLVSVLVLFVTPERAHTFYIISLSFMHPFSPIGSWNACTGTRRWRRRVVSFRAAPELAHASSLFHLFHSVSDLQLERMHKHQAMATLAANAKLAAASRKQRQQQQQERQMLQQQQQQQQKQQRDKPGDSNNKTLPSMPSPSPPVALAGFNGDTGVGGPTAAAAAAAALSATAAKTKASRAAGLGSPAEMHGIDMAATAAAAAATPFAFAPSTFFEVSCSCSLHHCCVVVLLSIVPCLPFTFFEVKR